MSGPTDKILSLGSFNIHGFLDGLKIEKDEPVAPAIRFVFNTVNREIPRADLELRSAIIDGLQARIKKRLTLFERYSKAFYETGYTPIHQAVAYAVVFDDLVHTAFSEKSGMDRSDPLDEDKVAQALYVWHEAKKYRQLYAENLPRRDRVDEYFEYAPIPAESLFLAHLDGLEIVHRTETNFDDIDSDDLSDQFSKLIYPIHHWADENTRMGQDLKIYLGALENRIVPRLKEYTGSLTLVRPTPARAPFEQKPS